MSRKARKHYTPQEKVAILREHLLEGKAVSEVCDRYELQPTVFYGWQKQFFENGAAAFERKNKRSEEGKDRQIAARHDKLAKKNEVIAELNLPKEVTFIGIAKGEERDAGREKFFIEGRDAFMLPHRDPVLYYVQRLRDEAHRFAIGTHRAKRKKDVVKNPLDEIEGIGPTRKRALLNHFGSAKAVARASLMDLESVPSISKAMAQLVYDHFNRT